MRGGGGGGGFERLEFCSVYTPENFFIVSLSLDDLLVARRLPKMASACWLLID